VTPHGSVTTTSTLDVHGRETSRTLPSLSVVTSSYTLGWLTSQTVPGAALAYSYDAWGGVSEVASDVGATSRTVRNTPLWVDAVELETGVYTQSREYGWHANGQLASKEAPGKFAETCAYDALGQLVEIANAVTGLPEESYAYGAGGDPVGA
jgi:YD repeat-containing protein